MIFMLICSILLTASTPEDFLMELCENSSGIEGAEFWYFHADSEVQFTLNDPDSLAQILGRMQELSVNTGARTAFQDSGNSFKIEFGESRSDLLISGNLNWDRFRYFVTPLVQSFHKPGAISFRDN
jgi:hypothetical protein